jgi:guanylate kinase
VQGARQVRTRGIETVGIFVLPPSAAVLAQRLRGRSQDSEEQIRTRLDVAGREVAEYAQYEYVVINDEVPAAVDRLRAIVLAERARVRLMRAPAEGIIGTFHGTSTEREQV